jgi:hypothetical protein
MNELLTWASLAQKVPESRHFHLLSHMRKQALLSPLSTHLPHGLLDRHPMLITIVSLLPIPTFPSPALFF